MRHGVSSLDSSCICLRMLLQLSSLLPALPLAAAVLAATACLGTADHVHAATNAAPIPPFLGTVQVGERVDSPHGAFAEGRLAFTPWGSTATLAGKDGKEYFTADVAGDYLVHSKVALQI